MLKFEGTDKIRDIKYEDGYVDKIYYDNNTLLVFTSDKEKTGVDEVLFKGRKLIDVTSYGKCEQNGTPTPDAPVDIVSNNGVLKVSGQKLINGNLADGVTNWNIPNNVSYTSNNDYVIFTKTSGSNIYVRCNTNGTRIEGHKYVYFLTAKVVGASSSSFGARNGSNTAIIDSIEQTLCILDTFPPEGGGEPWFRMPNNNISIYVSKRGGMRMFDLTAMGLEDMITTTAQALAYFGTIYRDPKEICTYSTVETINVHGKNLFDGTVYNIAHVSNPNRVMHNAAYRGIIIPVTAENKYTISRQTVAGNCFNWYFTPTYPQEGDTAYNTGLTTATNLSVTVTVPSGMSFLVVYFSTNASDILPSKIQVELGETATTYEPYYNGGTAMAEMLLKVGDYQDVQSIIDGVVTRNVGVKVLDGTEGWVVNGTNTNCYNLTGVNGIGHGGVVICTHLVSVKSSTPINIINEGKIKIHNTLNGLLYVCVINEFSTVNAWKAFLAAQYAAGTPVIVVYPLATSTTEQVTSQTLTIQQGNNTVEVTQASVDDILLKVKYK